MSEKWWLISNETVKEIIEILDKPRFLPPVCLFDIRHLLYSGLNETDAVPDDWKEKKYWILAGMRQLPRENRIIYFNWCMDSDDGTPEEVFFDKISLYPGEHWVLLWYKEIPEKLYLSLAIKQIFGDENV